MSNKQSGAHLTVVFPTAPSDLESLVQGYLWACEADGKTKATLLAYHWNLKRFTDAATKLGLPDDVRNVTRNDVRRYLASLRERGCSVATIIDSLKTLRIWFAWLVREGVLRENVAADIDLPRPDRNVLRTLSTDEVRDLVRVCQQEARNGRGRFLALRNEAIVLTLYNTGLRASEMVSLELRDLDLEGGLIHVRHGKGRKQRTVATGKRLRQVMWRYLQLRGREPGPLFVGKGGAALLRTSLTQLLSKLAKRTTWRDKQCGPHMLRRSFAVEFIRAGGDPFRLQILLGHEKLDMTRLYAQALSNEDALLSAAEFAPGDRL